MTQREVFIDWLTDITQWTTKLDMTFKYNVNEFNAKRHFTNWMRKQLPGSTYLYSIDGGQNFDNFNEFNNLAVGDYNIVVKDELEICLYEVTVPIEVETLVVINEINHKLFLFIIKSIWCIYPFWTKSSCFGIRKIRKL